MYYIFLELNILYILREEYFLVFSYMSSHIELFKFLQKRKNVRLAEHFVSFWQQVNKFNNTGAQILDSFYHLTLQLIQNHIFRVKKARF